MKSFLIFISILCFSQVYAQCPPNNDAEMRNHNNWQTYHGENTTPGSINLSTLFPSLAAGHQIMTGGAAGPFDANVGGTIMPTVVEGSHSFQLGDFTLSHVFPTGGNIYAMSQTFKVTALTPLLSFQWATVLEDGGHPVPEQAHFKFWVSKSSSIALSQQPNNLIHEKTVAIDGTDPFVRKIEGKDIFYRNWQTECLDLSEFINQDITIYFLVTDCVHKGHGAYAYIDGYCTGAVHPTHVFDAPSRICSLGELTNIDGSASFNYDEYFWKLEKVSGNGVAFPTIPKTDAISYHSGPIPSGYDIEQMYNNAGRSLTGGYYKLTLGLRNCSCNGQWFEQSVIIEVEKPGIVPEYGYGCCSEANTGTTITISALIDILPGTSGTASWYDESGNFISNGISTMVNTSQVRVSLAVNNINSYGKFRIKYITSNGCNSEDWVYAIKMPEIIGSSIYQKCADGDYCSGQDISVTLRYNNTCMQNMTDEWDELIVASIQYQWNTGERTHEIRTNSSRSQYTCTLTLPCHSPIIESIDIPTNLYSGVPNIVVPSGGSLTNPWFFIDANKPLNTSNAYNIYWYRLRIYDRWGTVLVSEKEDYAPCLGGFINGEIGWDQKAFGQPITTTTVFAWTLYYKNCDHPTETSYSAGNVTIVR